MDNYSFAHASMLTCYTIFLKQIIPWVSHFRKVLIIYVERYGAVGGHQVIICKETLFSICLS